MYAGEPHGMCDHIRRVELAVRPWAYGFVTAHEEREGPRLHPAGEQLAVALHLAEGEEAADVPMHHRNARKAEREACRHDTGQPIVTGIIRMLVAVPENGSVFLDAGIAGACKEHHVAAAVLLYRLAVQLRPQHRPLVVQQRGVAVVQDAVDGQILAEIRHPAGDAEIEHVPLYKHVLREAHRLGIRQVEHARVEGRRFYMIYAAVRAADEISPLGAVLV